ncbi:FAD-dependent monooxygenase [Streptacidiphilus monticola]
MLTVGANDAGFAFMAPFGDGWYRVIAWDRDDQQDDRAPVTEEELREAVRRVLGDDHGLGEARWLSRFHSDERQVPRYRDGRVFLAGDAAHCHSPAGGQGMNTGLQDAANLGWKLAAAVKGWTPDADALLDSYHAERHPVGAMVLRTSGGLIRVALAQTRTTRLARGVATALADHLGPVTRRGGLMVSGLAISYGGVRRAPDLALAGKPGRLYEALREGRFVLVGAGQGVADNWSDQLLRTEAAVADAPTRLVRPDGYVAWSADRPTAAELGAALADHLGGPR